MRETDGYAAVKGLVPPSERRALVLIDPPYEAQAAEFDAVRWYSLLEQERVTVWYTAPTALRTPTSIAGSLISASAETSTAPR